jgi:hypothetical protein
MEISMDQDYLQNWTLMVSGIQKPFQDMLDLHVKTLQGLKYLTIEDLSSMKQPRELLDKQIKLTMGNSHMILDYVTQSFQFVENSFLSFSKQFKENTVQSIKNSDAELSRNRKTVSEVLTKTVNSSEHKKAAKKNKIASTKNSLLKSKHKTTSNSTSIQTRVKAEQKTTASTRKKTLTKSKKDTAERKPILSNERQKATPVLSNAVSDKKEGVKKNKVTKLERNMGMPEPKTDLLLNQMSMSDDLVSNLPDIHNSTSEYHTSQYEHPLTKQEGKGKNPFKK